MVIQRAVVVSFILALAIAPGAAAAVRDDRTLVVLQPNLDIDCLDPAWATDAYSREVILAAYEPLVALKGDSLTELQPRLSSKVPSRANGLLSHDGTVYSFPIRRDVRFHDGSPMTCEDARYSILRFALLDRQTGGGSFTLLKPLSGALRTRDASGRLQLDVQGVIDRVVCDGLTLRITLPRAYPPFLQVLAQYGLVISKSWAVSRGVWDGRAETWGKTPEPKKEDSPFFVAENGTGPFLLERWDRAQKRLVLRRNTSYWRRPAALERVVLKEVPDASVRRMEVSAHDADVAEEPGTCGDDSLWTLPGTKACRPSQLRTDAFFFTFALDTASAPGAYSGKLDGEGVPPDFFADVDVRAGFAAAFDYDGYSKAILQGRLAALPGPIPDALLGNAADAPTQYDPEAARARLRRARGGAVWRNGFRLGLFYNQGDDSRRAACEIMKTSVEALNPKFKLDVQAVSWSTYLSGIRQRRFPIFMMGYPAAFSDPDSFAQAFLHSEGLYPRLQGNASKELDGAVEAAAYESDPAKRLAAYRELQTRAATSFDQIFLVHPEPLKVSLSDVELGPLNPMRPGIDFYAVKIRRAAKNAVASSSR